MSLSKNLEKYISGVESSSGAVKQLCVAADWCSNSVFLQLLKRKNYQYFPNFQHKPPKYMQFYTNSFVLLCLCLSVCVCVGLGACVCE